MKPIPLEGYSIIVRSSALSEKGIELKVVKSAMEGGHRSDGSGLLIFGPHFGLEAQDEFIKRLKKIGLEYVDDFFDINLDTPVWFSIFASMSDNCESGEG